MTLATPEAFVTELAAESVALAPELGAVKVTVTPLRGLPALSESVAWSGFENAALSGVACGVLAGVNDAGGPTMLDSWNVAAREPALAVTM